MTERNRVFYIEVFVTDPDDQHWETRLDVLRTALFHIAHDNLDDLGDAVVLVSDGPTPPLPTESPTNLGDWL